MKAFPNFLILIALFLTQNMVFSQEKGTLEEKTTALTSKMQEAIAFNDETKNKVYDINLNFLTETQKLKSEDVGKIKKFKTLKKLDKERDDSLKKVFTKKEFETFKAFKEENKKNLKERFEEARSQASN